MKVELQNRANLENRNDYSPFWGQIVSTVGKVVGTATDNKANQTQLELEQERARQAAIAAGMNRKTDYLPYIVIGGVLLIGGAVVIMSLKK
jgi:hypothetical protein